MKRDLYDATYSAEIYAQWDWDGVPVILHSNNLRSIYKYARKEIRNLGPNDRWKYFIIRNLRTNQEVVRAIFGSREGRHIYHIVCGKERG